MVDASGTPVPYSPKQFTSSNLGSPSGSGSDLDGMGTRPGRTTDEKLDALLSKFVHSEMQIAHIPALDVPHGFTVTTTLGDFATRRAEMEQHFSALTARMCKVETYDAASASIVSGSARSWPSLEQGTAPQPQGPVAQGHLMTTETQDVDLIFSQALRMNMHIVPSCSGSRVNNTAPGLRIGSITFGKSPTCQPVTNPSEFIVTQVAYPPDV